MKAVIWMLRFAIPLVVLYSIGYFVAGFSALSFYWLFWLAILITGGNWLIFRVFKKSQASGGKFILYFLVATVVVFMMTNFIEGGAVPLGGSILAALIISLLQTMIPDPNVVKH